LYSMVHGNVYHFPGVKGYRRCPRLKPRPELHLPYASNLHASVFRHVPLQAVYYKVGKCNGGKKTHDLGPRIRYSRSYTIFWAGLPRNRGQIAQKTRAEGYKSSTYTYGVAHPKLRPLQLKSLQSDNYTPRYGLLKPTPTANFDRP
jgi:hypothetical protein